MAPRKKTVEKKNYYEYQMRSFKIDGPKYAPQNRHILKSWVSYLDKFREGQARGMISMDADVFDYDNYYDSYMLVKKNNPSSKNIANEVLGEYYTFKSTKKAQKFYEVSMEGLKTSIKELRKAKRNPAFKQLYDEAREEDKRSFEVEDEKARIKIAKGKYKSYKRQKITFTVHEKIGKETIERDKTIYYDQYMNPDTFRQQFGTKSEIVSFMINVAGVERERAAHFYGY